MGTWASFYADVLAALLERGEPTDMARYVIHDVVQVFVSLGCFSCDGEGAVSFEHDLDLREMGRHRASGGPVRPMPAVA